MVNGISIFNVFPKVVTNFQLSWQLQLKCQRVSLPSPSRMQRETWDQGQNETYYLNDIRVSGIK